MIEHKAVNNLAHYLLGIDIGTGSIKVALLSEQAKVMALSAREYHIIRPQKGYEQIDRHDLWNKFLETLRETLNKVTVDLTAIAGIGISCLCPGLTAFSFDDEVLLDPILYTDRRSIAEADYIKDAVGVAQLFAITANSAMAGAISGTSMLWVKNHLPEMYAGIKYFGHVNTLFGALLTGCYGIDYSNASYTALFDTANTRTWSRTLCETIGIDIAKLPPLIKSTDIVGGLTNEAVVALGIPRGTPVVIGGADTPCASITCGVVRHGDACESVGTTNVLTICTERPNFNPGFINRCHVVDGTWIYQGAMSNTGASYRWAREELAKDLKIKAADTGSDTYALMNGAVAQTKPGSGGVVFLPYMAGERCPIWDPYAKGVFFGVTLDSKRGDMLRAILEGCGYGMRQLYEIAEQVTGTHYTRLLSVGGGSKNKVWAQIKADITGKTIEILDINEAAVIGAALLAGVGVGLYMSVEDATAHIQRNIYEVITPNPENEELYTKLYKIYTALYPRIKELYKM